ncbi:MAG TPA: hypothetical protein VJN67_07465 [Stellaceae bacterium]|nr:hypothetical protein [Stellaceae bacterium]
MLGNDLTERYVSYVRNGETVLYVRAWADGELTATVETMRHYAPIRVDRLRAPEGLPP